MWDFLLDNKVIGYIVVVTAFLKLGHLIWKDYKAGNLHKDVSEIVKIRRKE